MRGPPVLEAIRLSTRRRRVLAAAVLMVLLGAPGMALAEDGPTSAASFEGAQAAAAGTSTINGTVHDEADDAIEGVCVSAFADGEAAEARSTVTAGDGTYTLDGLGIGTYQVRFDPCEDTSLAIEWFDDQPTRDLATDIAVGDDADVTDIDAMLGEGGAISGRVKDDEGGLLAGVCVDALSPAGDPAQSTVTSLTGRYTLGALAAGDYVVRYSSCSDVDDDDDVYATEFYDDAAALADADAVTVEAGTTTGDIDAELAVGEGPVTTTTSTSTTTTSTTVPTGADTSGVLSVDPPDAPLGSLVKITSGGWRPSTEVRATLYSDPLFLGASTAGSTGIAVLNVRIPASTSSGTHRIELTGTGAGGAARTVNLSFLIEGGTGSTSGGALARTGMALALIGALGIAFTVAGVAVLQVRRAVDRRHPVDQSRHPSRLLDELEPPASRRTNDPIPDLPGGWSPSDVGEALELLADLDHFSAVYGADDHRTGIAHSRLGQWCVSRGDLATAQLHLDRAVSILDRPLHSLASGSHASLSGSRS